MHSWAGSARRRVSLTMMNAENNGLGRGLTLLTLHNTARSVSRVVAQVGFALIIHRICLYFLPSIGTRFLKQPAVVSRRRERKRERERVQGDRGRARASCSIPVLLDMRDRRRNFDDCLP